MDDVKPAEFVFMSYQIPEFSGTALDITYENINLTFDPFGNYDENSGQFRLTINLIATGTLKTEKTDIIKAKIIALFDFPPKPAFEEIPTFFYANSIAIVFPYFRAFVSSLTVQAQVPLIIMPVLNLSALEPILRANTSLVRRPK